MARTEEAESQQITVFNSLALPLLPPNSLTLAPTATPPSTKEGAGLRVEGESAGTKRRDGAAAAAAAAGEERRTATVVVENERRDADAPPRMEEEAAPARAWSVGCIVSR